MAHTLGLSSDARADRADIGVAAAADCNEDDDGADYGAKADNAYHKDNKAH
ncbi:hypothetical protein ACFZAV_13200 [Streptomyces sp. NPDC008343]|uniref:hypothetical protein n=1 Tax=Streptomyces sp. NPDC008343 TaxID=3364828 RepID=UPI0036ECAF47